MRFPRYPRKIELRGWDTEEKSMLGNRETLDRFYDESVVKMLYSGIWDRDNVMIFEKDIVLLNGKCWNVEWETTAFILTRKLEKDEPHKYGTDTETMLMEKLSYKDLKSILVVGNRYKTPELCKEVEL